jgi:cobalt/nickel transport system permease protein
MMSLDSGQTVLAMHIPDNFISPQFDAVFYVVMIPVWSLCLRYIVTHLDAHKLTTLGAGAAFSFLMMMFNVPVPGGTTAHAVGGALVAILLGPQAACIGVSTALLLQSLIFGDGGILTFGANSFNMAFVLPFAAYGIYRLLVRLVPGPRGGRIGAALGGYVSLNLAALCTGIELGLQPELFRTASGQALYFPYPLSVSIPSMLIPHLVVAGVLEGAITVAVVEFVRRSAPDMIQNETLQTGGNVGGLQRRWWVVLSAIAFLTPLGLLAAGGAWGEWGTDTFVQDTGLSYVPQGIAHGFSYSALLPDYSMRGLPDTVGYVISAFVGLASLVIIFRIVSYMILRRRGVKNA